jgi:methylthioribose-1-phosphate isomerase
VGTEAGGDPIEVTKIRDVRIAPEGVNVRNPSFDVTPSDLITAIIIEQGVLRPPLSEAIENVLHG